MARVICRRLAFGAGVTCGQLGTRLPVLSRTPLARSFCSVAARIGGPHVWPKFHVNSGVHRVS